VEPQKGRTLPVNPQKRGGNKDKQIGCPNREKKRTKVPLQSKERKKSYVLGERKKTLATQEKGGGGGGGSQVKSSHKTKRCDGGKEGKRSGTVVPFGGKLLRKKKRESPMGVPVHLPRLGGG